MYDFQEKKHRVEYFLGQSISDLELFLKCSIIFIEVEILITKTWD